jgi:hypothetical protein
VWRGVVNGEHGRVSVYESDEANVVHVEGWIRIRGRTTKGNQKCYTWSRLECLQIRNPMTNTIVSTKGLALRSSHNASYLVQTE